MYWTGTAVHVFAGIRDQLNYNNIDFPGLVGSMANTSLQLFDCEQGFDVGLSISVKHSTRTKDKIHSKKNSCPIQANLEHV